MRLLLAGILLNLVSIIHGYSNFDPHENQARIMCPLGPNFFIQNCVYCIYHKTVNSGLKGCENEFHDELHTGCQYLANAKPTLVLSISDHEKFEFHPPLNKWTNLIMGCKQEMIFVCDQDKCTNHLFVSNGTQILN